MLDIDTAPAFRLSASAYQVLWEKLRLPEMPVVLHVHPHGYEEHERTAAINAAWDELHRDDLVRNGGIRPELVDALTLLARPARAVDARLWLGHEVRALAAGSGPDGVLAVLEEGVLSLRAIYPGGLARAVVGLLPTRAAGPGHSVSLPSAVIDTAAQNVGSSVKSFAEALRGNGISAADAEAVAEMIEGAEQSGQFGATLTDRLGRRNRADHVVAFFDTAAGRYLMEEHRGSDGTPWTTMSPADGTRLTGQLEHLLGELAQD
ncbi:ESX secretion-associated protein EspG [Crossiella sp. CA198]|uniref:ESX secretion-associated protein EspG n=1 Tax=Crossiella sp. CA198 TaxID=3455607 RepID=UPI003F8D6A7A